MNSALLRTKITTYFNKSELQNLCHDLNVKYENLAGETLEDKARELVEYCLRYKLDDKLLQLCQNLRPNVDWAEVVRSHHVGDVLSGSIKMPPAHKPFERATQRRDNEVVFQASVKQTYKEVLFAMSKLGTVSVEEPDVNAISGIVRYGFQSVKVRASLAEIGVERTKVVIQASSDDIWNAGAKSATKRLVETLLNIDNPGYKPDRLGVHPAALAGVVVLFILIFILTFPYVYSFFLSFF